MGAIAFSAAETKVLKERYSELSEQEFEAFIGACQRYSLNPLANQIYARLQRATDRSKRSVNYVCQIDG